MEELYRGNMAYRKTVTFNQSPSTCYGAALAALAQCGFTVMRKRELAWLVQAKTEVAAKTRVINITCQPGAATQITIGCLDTDSETDDKVILLIDSIIQAMTRLLKSE